MSSLLDHKPCSRCERPFISWKYYEEKSKGYSGVKLPRHLSMCHRCCKLEEARCE